MVKNIPFRAALFGGCCTNLGSSDACCSSGVVGLRVEPSVVFRRRARPAFVALDLDGGLSLREPVVEDFGLISGDGFVGE